MFACLPSHYFYKNPYQMKTPTTTAWFLSLLLASWGPEIFSPLHQYLKNPPLIVLEVRASRRETRMLDVGLDIFIFIILHPVKIPLKRFFTLLFKRNLLGCRLLWWHLIFIVILWWYLPPPHTLPHLMLSGRDLRMNLGSSLFHLIHFPPFRNIIEPLGR